MVDKYATSLNCQRKALVAAISVPDEIILPNRVRPVVIFIPAQGKPVLYNAQADILLPYHLWSYSPTTTVQQYVHVKWE